MKLKTRKSKPNVTKRTLKVVRNSSVRNKSNSDLTMNLIIVGIVLGTIFSLNYLFF